MGCRPRYGGEFEQGPSSGKIGVPGRFNPTQGEPSGLKMSKDFSPEVLRWKTDMMERQELSRGERMLMQMRLKVTLLLTS